MSTKALPYKFCGNCGYPSGMYKYCTACGRNLDRERSKAVARIKQLTEDTSLRKTDAELVYFHFVYHDSKMRGGLKEMSRDRERFFLEELGTDPNDDGYREMLKKSGKALRFHEYGVALNYLYKEAPPSELLSFLFQCYDSDSDAKLDRDELLLLLKSNMDLGALLRDGEDVARFHRRLYTWLKKNYALADTDGDGMLDFLEVRGLLGQKLDDRPASAPLLDHVRLNPTAVFRHLAAADASEVQFAKDVKREMEEELKKLQAMSFGLAEAPPPKRTMDVSRLMKRGAHKRSSAKRA